MPEIIFDNETVAEAIRRNIESKATYVSGEDFVRRLSTSWERITQDCPKCGANLLVCCHAEMSEGDSHHYAENWCHVCINSGCQYGDHNEDVLQVGYETSDDGCCPFCGRVVWGSNPQPSGLIYADDTSQNNLPKITSVHQELKKYFARHPDQLYQLDPRSFEGLVADILHDLGFDTQLTKATRDGGKDIYAYMRTEITSFLLYVECKRWSPENHVGIDVVQRLYGAAKAGGANKAVIVTTSFFTLPAKEEQRKMSNEMDLRDFESLKQWLQKYQ